MQAYRAYCLRFALTTCLAVAAASASLSGAPPDSQPSSTALESLQGWLGRPRDQRPPLKNESFSSSALTKEDAAKAQNLLWQDHAAWIRSTRADEMKAKRIELDGRTMKFDLKIFGEKPATGYSLFISMHGGGGAPPQVNEKQWINQLRLGDAYLPTEGVYLTPRAPTDTWNLWHQGHIDAFFDRIIENLIVLEGINANRVFLMGYSAGGDGVYQLAPRMADRLAAASMMAGHPNEASPLGLRNIGFALHMGALDSAYRRNAIAGEWQKRLDELASQDPGGYAHQVQIHEGKGHWMELEDRAAIPFMEKFTRNPRPTKIVWYQDDVIHDRLYWVGTDPAHAAAGDQITAERTGSTISLTTSRDFAVSLWLDDSMLDADQPVTVTKAGAVVFSGPVTRTISALQQSLAERGQSELMFPVRLEVPASPQAQR